ncbi:hypothetical protein E0Z10_g2410 [Xylaria hypoxylon]|uniref:C2H2-type domain-containing protein n=1 Tax=Xylaria hypoxylon TaxID=37992 RepID=A0A4Z0Z3U2_9PEZI|nr:hypothetical protein E0Z10_g2410 [Xylaria hypoxylon]
MLAVPKDKKSSLDRVIIPFSPPPFRDYATPPFLPDKPCSFRHAVLDECYQSRFWGRALEFYLLENELHSAPYRCLMVSCPERDFKDPKAMLTHLKHCKLFPQGKFWCPTCHQEDSFKVVSKNKCSWDKVNIARKLFQKSLKAIQRISGNRGRSHCGCSCHISQNDTFGNGQFSPPSETPMPPAGFDVQFHQIEEAAAATLRWELPNTAMIPELCETRQSSYMNNLKPSRHPSCSGAPVPETPSHQISPSDPSSASSDRSGYSSDISPTSVTLTNESPVLGHLPPESIAITMQPFPITRQASQASRRGEVPPLTVNTSQSVVDMTPELVFEMLLDEGETLDPSLDMNGLITPDLFPINPSQTNETPPLNTSYNLFEPLAPQNNTYLYPSPSMSVPSYSNHELSPSSMSSEPDQLQCPYTDCHFKPSGKIGSLKAYMRKHMKNHLKNEIPCEHCDKTFTRQDNLTNHMRKVHPDVNESPSKRRRSSLESLRSTGQPRRKEHRREAYEMA